jgi:ArsR family transcriptional regulator
MSQVAGTKFDDAAINTRSGQFNALGDEIRLKMIKLLAQHDALCVCEIQEAFDVGQPTISHHLRILRDAGVVDVERRGTWAYYSLRRDTLKDLTQELVAAM